jgi:hypothetical protein
MINLTPFTVTIRILADADIPLECEYTVLTSGEREVRIPPSGMVARVQMKTYPSVLTTLEHSGVPCHRVEYGPASIPEGVALNEGLIVGTVFADAYRRQHPTEIGVVLLVPDSGPSAIREDGRIVAVRQLLIR